MDNAKTDRYYINKILKDINFIILQSENIDRSEFEANEVLQDSMMFRLIQLSENAGRISSDFKSVNSTIPWRDISGLRNKIVHDYGNVNLDIVFYTLKDDIPRLKEMLESVSE